jgi:polar amino acid transport system permease protein
VAEEHQLNGPSSGTLSVSKRRAARPRWFGHVVALVVLAALGYGVYLSSKSIDYIWRWERMPQYLIQTGGEEIPAPFDGTVTLAADGKSLTIAPLLGVGKPETISGLATLEVSDGEIVFKNNPLGRKPGIKPGILLEGLWLTLRISVVALVGALVIGLLVGLGRVSKNTTVYDLSTVYVELIRGTPLLVQIFIFYFFFGTVLHLSAFAAGALALSIFTGAYVAEIVRAGIQAVPKGQTEAAQSLGLSSLQTLLYVVLPQATRRTLPPLAGQFISLIKDSSLVSAISLTDLTKAGREVASSTFSQFEVLFTVAAMYLVLTGGLSWAVNRLEKRLARHD